MKIKYQQPRIRVVQLHAEDAIMLTTSGTQVDTSADDFNQRTQERDLWGNEDIWK